MTALAHSVVSVDKFTLIIFYTNAHCWQFRVIGAGGVVFRECMYYTALAAENAPTFVDSSGELSHYFLVWK